MGRSAYLRVVDHRGRKIPRAPGPERGSALYEGATYGRRLSAWGSSGAGPDAALWGSLRTLRARARQMVRNDPLATGGLDTLVANLVGMGITPRWELKEDPELKREIGRLWADWTAEADADGLLDFYGIQALVARELVEAGEVLIRFRPRRPESGLSVPLQLQVIEADHLDAGYNSELASGNRIRMGIEFDRQGRRVAYHLYREHPGEMFLAGTDMGRTRVKADEVIHVYRVLRAGQKRGVPWLAAVILTQHDLNEFDDAEIVRKKGAAMIGGYIVERPGESLDYPPIGERQDRDSEGREVVAMEPGTFPVLPEGMDVRFSTPADVGGGYEAFTRRQDRRVARGFGGMSYEKYSGDLSNVNYSSIRAGNLEFQRVCKQIIYNVLVHRFCRRVAERWMDYAVLSGRLRIRDYDEARRKYNRVKWDIDGWEWVDPEKDVKAEKDAVRSGFKSRSQVVGERGRDAEAVDVEIAEDNARADGLGNIYDSDGRKTDRAGKRTEDEGDA